MLYPKLREIQTSRDMVDAFGGYNHNMRIGAGEFYEMTNLSSDNYPVLSPRHKRGVYYLNPDKNKLNGIIAKDKLCYVEGSKLVIDGVAEVELGLTDGVKTLVSMGSYVIIFPDKKYVNINNVAEDDHNMEHYFTAPYSDTNIFSFSPCQKDGTAYKRTIVKSPIAPLLSEQDIADTENIPLWYDMSLATPVMKDYSYSSGTWIEVESFVRITAGNFNDSVEITPYPIGEGFGVGDSVTINGIVANGALHLNGDTTIANISSDYIVVYGALDDGVTQLSNICISRWTPQLDFVIESGNRLWGCRYGKAYKGKALVEGNVEDVYTDEYVNEIYASKLGDFKNWNAYDGLSTDSYAASVGTDGEFTGAVTHLGYPIFFKENCMHKVYGNYPANYQTQTTECRGVQKGCGRSLAIVNEMLYYKSRSGVCAYDGSLPTEISAALGDIVYEKAVAGTLGNKYYISMSQKHDGVDEYHLFVYDTGKGMWHREDKTHATGFATYNGDIYYIDYDTATIKTVKGTGTLEDFPVRWEATTGIIGTDSPDKKYVSRLDVRMTLNANESVAFYAEYDSSGTWEYLFTMDGTKLQTFSVPVQPKRCDHMRLKLIGYGDARIFSICKTVEQGSDH